MYYQQLRNNKKNVCSINEKGAGYTCAFSAKYNVNKMLSYRRETALQGAL